ncbi:putative endoribonuclease L-PSP (Protein synthesis inhibitor) [uncultured Alphaproteobacteria bacterium]|uniref:Putative endoribonuclease L-PSP (Protein synthesis inhibitor) n=1 Tax=uncultured Alphaproteobacteria bacterium TaxID=91750 RepID=A0A212JGU0_9PROT|nr:putative endoribonuclease L-PSP (Protein synthesis inhibitor) [uncultured Alphaproteobacteria bacterium]
MADAVKTRLAELGLALPKSAAPVANYVPFHVEDGMVFVSGQLPMTDAGLFATGRVGAGVDTATAVEAARLAALQSIAKLADAAGGDLDRIAKILRVDVFVASSVDYFDQPVVGNGASDLFVAVFGEAGRHTRNAVGVAVLPRNAPVEVTVIAKLKD